LIVINRTTEVDQVQRQRPGDKGFINIRKIAAFKLGKFLSLRDHKRFWLPQAGFWVSSHTPIGGNTPGLRATSLPSTSLRDHKRFWLPQAGFWAAAGRFLLPQAGFWGFLGFLGKAVDAGAWPIWPRRMAKTSTRDCTPRS
jgi:hypothetical protein